MKNEQKLIAKVANVGFSYNGRQVLASVSFEVYKNDFICIVGPNGGGKTTLLKLLLGVVNPGIGEIKVFGKAPKEASHRIGYMPQQTSFDSSFPISVMEVVLCGRLKKGRWFGRYKNRDKEIALEMLKKVGMDDYLDRSFFNLSGGQKQRVLIARAMAGKPKLLLLDEPTANLDTESEFEFFELLNELNSEVTIIIVSHNPNFVSSFVKSVICVNKKVAIHPTGAIPDELTNELIGEQARIILHNQQCKTGRETPSNS